jgi:aspartokinase
VQTIAEAVASLVARSPFLVEALSEGLINVSALARRLRPEVERLLDKPVKAGAIIMAINRMPFGALTNVERDLRRFFRRVSDISVRSNLLDYTFANSDTLLERQTELLERLGRQPKTYYSSSQGVSETTIIVSEHMETTMDQVFADEKLLDKEADLSALTLVLPAENRSLFGVYYYILKDLAWDGINLVELISTSHEFTVIVRREDLERTFSALQRLR